MDVYLSSLCGFAFNKKELTPDQLKYTEHELKVPVLNNLALCLMKLNRYERAVAMLDQALKVSRNFKSTLRKCQCFIELTEYQKAEACVVELEELAF